MDAMSANEMSGLQGRVKHYGHAIHERQRPVLTSQCLGKETNAEPPGRGTDSEESAATC